MDILGNIVSILPTIGSVVGGLLQEIFKTGNDVDASKTVTYNLSLDTDPKNAELVDFMVDKNTKEITLHNRCRFPLFLSTPAKNGYTGETQFIDVGEAVPLNSMFSTMSDYDLDELQISGATQSAENDGVNSIQIASSGTLTIGDVGKSLGTYIFASVSTDSISIEVNEGALAEVLSLRLRAADGTTTMEVSNIRNSVGLANIHIPLSVEQEVGQQVHLFVSLTIGGLKGGWECFRKKNPYQTRKTTEEELKELRRCDSVRAARKVQKSQTK